MEYFVEKILPYIVGAVIGGMVIALVYLMFFESLSSISRRRYGFRRSSIFPT